MFMAKSFSFTAGSLFAIIIYFAPLKVLSVGKVPSDAYLLIQAVSFLSMFTSDHLSGASYIRVNEYFNAAVREHRSNMDRSWVQNRSNSNRTGNMSIQFSQLGTEDAESDADVCPDTIPDLSQASAPHCGTEVIATGGSSAVRKEAYSIFILVAAGCLLEFSKGLYLNSAKREINYLEIFKYMSYNFLISYSISVYLITVQFSSIYLSYLMAMLAFSPLVASFVFTVSPVFASLRYDEFIDGVFTLFYCGSALYWICMCVIPSAVYRSAKEEETTQMLFALLGFGVTYYLGNYFNIFISEFFAKQ
jgi:hypothetical protein